MKISILFVLVSSFFVSLILQGGRFVNHETTYGKADINGFHTNSYHAYILFSFSINSPSYSDHLSYRATPRGSAGLAGVNRKELPPRNLPPGVSSFI